MASAIIIGGLTSHPVVANSEGFVGSTIPNVAPSTELILKQIATDAAISHGVNVEHFINTGACEIKKRKVDGQLVWDYKAKSDIDPNSWGWYQINLDAHPDITREQAQDPVWAANWAARQFASGNAWMWTCWKDYYT